MRYSIVHPPEPKLTPWAPLVCCAAAGISLWRAWSPLPTLLALCWAVLLLLAYVRRARQRSDTRHGLGEQLEQAAELLERGAHRQALRLVERVAQAAQSAPIQRRALELSAWCHLGLGEPQAARNALSWVGGASGLDPWLDPYCCAAVEDACGAGSWALHLLERAAKRRPLSREATLLRIDLYARLRGIEAACLLTLRELSRLRPPDARRVVRFAQAAGHAAAAATLERALGASD